MAVVDAAFAVMSVLAVVEESEDVDAKVFVAVTDDSIGGRNKPLSIFCFSRLFMISILPMQSRRPLSTVPSGSTAAVAAATAVMAAAAVAAVATAALSSAAVAATLLAAVVTPGMTSIKIPVKTDADNGDTEEAK